MSEKKGGELVERDSGRAVQRTLNLEGGTSIDVSNLSEDAIKALEGKHAANMVELQAMAQKKLIDLGTTEKKLSTFTRNVGEMSEKNISATITNVSEDSLGRTETIIGNSEHAQKGLLSNRQAGQKDNTMMYVIIGAIVVVMLAFAFAK